jgi:putative membrane protein
VYFGFGWMFLALALVSPLHPLGETLFSAHMVQHEILMLAAAPLLVLSRPLVPMLWGLSFDMRRGAGRAVKAPLFAALWHLLTRPFAAWSIHAAALWVWHAPLLFEATLTSDWVHTGQHLSFLLTALAFWWSLFYGRAGSGKGGAVLYVFTTAVHTSILGALLTFSSVLWYPAYSATAANWGLTPLEDQQIGGLIMWVPAGLVYLGVGLSLLLMWLRESGGAEEAPSEMSRYQPAAR